MKRNIFLATAAAVTLLAVPAMAQPSYGGRGDRGDSGYGGSFGKRPIPAPAPHVEMPSISSYGPHSAKAGATVTIYGSAFAPGTMVNLGGKLIAPTLVNAKRIKFVVPAGAADGSLSLVLPNHRRALAVGAFDVIEPVIVRPGRGYRDNGYFNTRGSRRTASRRAVLSRWNNRWFLNTPAARAELRIHAQRLAKLSRMKRLAAVTGKTFLAARINRAIAKENARHELKMKQLERTFLASWTAPRPRGRF